MFQLFWDSDDLQELEAFCMYNIDTSGIKTLRCLYCCRYACITWRVSANRMREKQTSDWGRYLGWLRLWNYMELQYNFSLNSKLSLHTWKNTTLSYTVFLFLLDSIRCDLLLIVVFVCSDVWFSWKWNHLMS